MLQFLDQLKLCTKLVSRQYIQVFSSKFTWKNVCLSFVIFTFYLQSSTKVFSASRTSHWVTISSEMSITIALPYISFSFLSVITSLSFETQRFYLLLFVLIPSLHWIASWNRHYILTQSNIWKLWSNEYQEVIFLDNIVILY